MRLHRLLVLSFVWVLASPSVEASRFSFGGSGGAEFPFAHGSRVDWGPRGEGFFRVDPYEVRFSYADMKVDVYSVVVGRKLFFSESLLRPYVEAAGGFAIQQTDSKGLAYGLTPVVSLGTDLGINSFLSAQVNLRYSAYWVFGKTGSGKMEANHSLSLLGGLSLWF